MPDLFRTCLPLPPSNLDTGEGLIMLRHCALKALVEEKCQFFKPLFVQNKHGLFPGSVNHPSASEGTSKFTSSPLPDPAHIFMTTLSTCRALLPIKPTPFCIVMQMCGALCTVCTKRARKTEVTQPSVLHDKKTHISLCQQFTFFVVVIRLPAPWRRGN